MAELHGPGAETAAKKERGMKHTDPVIAAVPRDLTPEGAEELITIALKRTELRDHLRAALIARDIARALDLSRELCGLQGDWPAEAAEAEPGMDEAEG